ncbi:DNA-binding protein WhiA [Anaerosalibacter sp. Marseille-P3206]|uniref:DNA-binding protein WhiA n=1 Tax=Anaerosalibacter sp. Marseille-P3206 TaxID=1871005 RepID=UPI000985DCA9|nr:DNA-binding protein WhiA [Anaerosalibacter sp. Marseille-P3206]
MSFSSATKNELSRILLEDRCCAIAELAALVRMNGFIQISGNNKVYLKFTTENAAIARRTFSLLKKLYETNVDVMVRKNKQLKKNNNYLIAVSSTNVTKKILNDVGLIKGDSSDLFKINYKIPHAIIKNRCCKRAYIRGAFLGGGSISNPEKTYHLEFVTNNEQHAENLSKLINTFGLNSKIVLRKDSYVVYLKEGEQIVDLLNIMGAHLALLKLEDIRVLKDMRNNINRIVNCETANLEKTINASLRQVENIECIEATIGLEKLPENLQEIAELRLQHKDASLKELGSMLNPPVGKSGINHRFRRIEEIADKLRKGD